jgi:dephospho-CoA kinase
MMVIGICGRSGSGKSTVCRVFSDHKIAVLDCDVIYHELINFPSPCLDAVRERFGDAVVCDGRLDRTVLKNIVFHNKEALLDLNRITHRFVLDELSKRIQSLRENGWKACVIDAPLFFEANLQTWCDVVCGVVSKDEIQIERICARDGISREEAVLRLNGQISRDEIYSRCDHIIENTGDIDQLYKSSLDFLKKLNLLS